MAPPVATAYTSCEDREKGLVYALTTADGQEIQIAENEIICLSPSSMGNGDKILLHLNPETSPDIPAESISTGLQLHGPSLLGHFRRYEPSPAVLAYLRPDDPFLSELGHIIIFISTLAGSQKAQAIYENRIRYVIRHTALNLVSKTFAVYKSTSADFITQQAPHLIITPAAQGHSNLIILISGDGGMVEIIDTIYTFASSHKFTASSWKAPTIALIPAGTGNALAHSSGIAGDGTGGLATLMRGSPHPLPVFRVSLPAGSKMLDSEGRVVGGYQQRRTVHGAVVFSWALHSTLVADSDTPAYRKHGSSRFQMAAKELLFPEDGGAPHAFRGTLSYRARDADAENWTLVQREKHAYVLLTLVSNLEEKFRVSPKSMPLDGVMRLVHFAPFEHTEDATGGKGVMRIMEAAYDDGKHVDDKHVEYEEVDGLRLNMEEDDERWRRVCIDGKIFVVPKGDAVEVAREERSLVELVVLDR